MLVTVTQVQFFFVCSGEFAFCGSNWRIVNDACGKYTMITPDEIQVSTMNPTRLFKFDDGVMVFMGFDRLHCMAGSHRMTCIEVEGIYHKIPGRVCFFFF